MKTVENRVPQYCSTIKRCVIWYHGVTKKNRNFKSCSHIDPSSCQLCEILQHSLSILSTSKENKV